MEPAIKKVVAVLAVALLVVIGVIALTNGAKDKAAVTTAQEDRTTENLHIDPSQTDDPTKTDAQKNPADGEEAGQAGASQTAQEDHNAQEEMYEGALAGMSEDEIAKMALAEEESAARTETTGAEDAVD